MPGTGSNTPSVRADEILRHAARLFAARGYHATSVRDLCRAVDLGPAAFYHHLASKEDCLRLIQVRAFTALLQGGEAAVEGAGPEHRERMRAFVRHHLRFFAERLPEMRVLSHEGDTLEGEARAEVDALKRDYTRLTRRLVGEVSGLPYEETFVPAMALLGSLNWLYTWHDRARDPAPDVIADTILTTFLGGLPSLKPRGA